MCYLSILMVKEVKGGGVEELKDLLVPARVLHQVHQGGVGRHTPEFKKYYPNKFGKTMLCQLGKVVIFGC